MDSHELAQLLLSVPPKKLETSFIKDGQIVSSLEEMRGGVCKGMSAIYFSLEDRKAIIDC